MNKKGAYFLSVDFGTESVRAGVLDLQGSIISSAVREYKTYFVRNGWAEQNPDEWWSCFVQAVREAVERSGVRPESIRSMTFDTTCSTVAFLDEDFKPLRNALIWMDVRSARQAGLVADSGAAALKYNGFGKVSAGWMVPKVLWVKENEPEVFKKARYICEFQDWINRMTTGEYTGAINNATIRGYYDVQGGGWPLDMYKTLGITDLIEKLPRKMGFMGDPAGPVLPEVADACGLSRSTRVVIGGCDACAGMIGLGTYKPGDICLITGSSHVMFGMTTKEFHNEKVWGTYMDAVRPGVHFVEGSQVSTGSVLKWFREEFIKDSYYHEAERRGMGILDYLSTLAADIGPGSDGLMLLEYWQGNRNPFSDSRARGAIWGLSLSHGAPHVYRAILEGVSCGVAHILQAFRDSGLEPKQIRACGGATRSPLWMQIQSDIAGLSILLPENPDAPLVGGGVTAAFGAGEYNTMEEAIDNMVSIARVVEPDPERSREYQFYVEKHLQTYHCLKDLMHDMVMHEEDR